MTTPITALPQAPNRLNDTPSEFADNADAFAGALPTFVTQVNTVGDEMEVLASNAETSATNAATSEANAATSAAVSASNANYKGVWSAQTGAANVPYSVTHNSKEWRLLNDIADVTASEPGVTGDWSEISQSTLRIVSNTSITSPVTSVELTIPSSGNFILDVGGIEVSSSGTVVNIQTSEDGANFENNNYVYGSVYRNAGAAQGGGSPSATSILLASGVGLGRFWGRIKFNVYSDSVEFHMSINSYNPSASQELSSSDMGFRSNSSAIQKIRIYPASGNFTSGILRLYQVSS